MAYTKTIDLVQNDRLPQIEVVLRDSNTAASGQILDAEDPTTFDPINLGTGASAQTVRMRVRKIGSTTIISNIIGTNTDAAAGKVTFEFATNTFATSGNYEAEIELTDSQSRTQTVVDLIRFKVRSEFG